MLLQEETPSREGGATGSRSQKGKGSELYLLRVAHGNFFPFAAAAEYPSLLDDIFHLFLSLSLSSIGLALWKGRMDEQREHRHARSLVRSQHWEREEKGWNSA